VGSCNGAQREHHDRWRCVCEGGGEWRCAFFHTKDKRSASQTSVPAKKCAFVSAAEPTCVDPDSEADLGQGQGGARSRSELRRASTTQSPAEKPSEADQRE
jgi:hypothetical protein